MRPILAAAGFLLSLACAGVLLVFLWRLRDLGALYGASDALEVANAVSWKVWMIVATLAVGTLAFLWLGASMLTRRDE